MRENRNALAAIMQGAEACEQFGHRVFGSHRFVAPFGQARREQNRTEKHWKDQNRAEQNYKTALETAERPGLGFGQENFAFCNLYACSVEFFFSFLFVYFFFFVAWNTRCPFGASYRHLRRRKSRQVGSSLWSGLWPTRKPDDDDEDEDDSRSTKWKYKL